MPNSDYFNQLLEEYKQLCELYRIRFKFHFCEVVLREKYVNVLFWTIKRNNATARDGKKLRMKELYSYSNDFHRTHLPIHIEILKEKLK